VFEEAGSDCVTVMLLSTGGVGAVATGGEVLPVELAVVLAIVDVVTLWALEVATLVVIPGVLEAAVPAVIPGEAEFDTLVGIPGIVGIEMPAVTRVVSDGKHRFVGRRLPGIRITVVQGVAESMKRRPTGKKPLTLYRLSHDVPRADSCRYGATAIQQTTLSRAAWSESERSVHSPQLE
jgi:hypothetical protein